MKSKSDGQPLLCEILTNFHIVLDLEVLNEFPSANSFQAFQFYCLDYFQYIFYK